VFRPTVVHNDAHVGAVLKVEGWLRFRFGYYVSCFCCFNLEYFVLLLFGFAVLGSFS